MPTFRIEKTSNYSVISNELIRDKKLPLSARGLLIFMLSLDDDWDFSCKGLVVATGVKETILRTCLKELEKNGYLRREPVKDKGIIRDWIYWIYEKPLVDYPQVEKPHVGEPHVENLAQINTKEINTKEINTKEINTNNSYVPNKKTKGVIHQRIMPEDVIVQEIPSNLNEELNEILSKRSN